MFNPHNLHQQQQHQQHQQFQQHLRQLQHLFQQQAPPPPPPPPPQQPPSAHHVPHPHPIPHHHPVQAQRAIPVAPQAPPAPRMVNLCQATQTTIISPNHHMLQGAIMMQRMQGSMRGFAVANQHYRQFYAAGPRNSILGPVPIGVALKPPMMGFPPARHFHPHGGRYYPNTNPPNATPADFLSAWQAADRKRDSEQRAAGNTDGQPAASATNDTAERGPDGVTSNTDERTEASAEPTEEPVVKKPRTDGVEESSENTNIGTHEVIIQEYNNTTEDSPSDDCILIEAGGSIAVSDAAEELEESRTAELIDTGVTGQSPSDKQHVESNTIDLEEEVTEDEAALLDGEEEGMEETAVEARENIIEEPMEKTIEEHKQKTVVESKEKTAEEAKKFYCYLCSITCHNQQNFQEHMIGLSHQQRMMEIQHMSNTCLVTLLPHVQESLRGACKDGEKGPGLQHRGATWHADVTSNNKDHKGHEESSVASLDYLVEDEEGSEVEQEEGQRNDRIQSSSPRQEGWSSQADGDLEDLASDEEYDTDTVYGSSFLIPVAGFLCRLCKRFYHFQSSGLHSHCKSLKHFENLKKYRRHQQATEVTIDFASEDHLSSLSDTNTDRDRSDNHISSEIDVNQLMQPTVNITRVRLPKDRQRKKKLVPTSMPQSLNSTATASSSSTQPAFNPVTSMEQAASQTCAAWDSSSELREEPQLQPVEAIEEATEKKVQEPSDILEETVVPEKSAVPETASTGKARATNKRRSGRATSRR